MTSIGDHGLTLPFELIAMIAAELDDSCRIDSSARAHREPSVITDLQKFRLINKAFAEAGAAQLFSHLIVPLSRNVEAGDPLRTGPIVCKQRKWADLRLSKSMEFVAKLASSRFAHHIKTISFRISSEPGSLDKDDVSSLAAANFAHLKNVKTLRIIVAHHQAPLLAKRADYVRDCAYWISPIRSTAHELPKLQQVLVVMPDWAVTWFATQMTTHTLRIELSQRELPGRWSPGHHLPIISNVRSLYLACGLPNSLPRGSRDTIRIYFDGLTCHNLRELTLRQIRVNNSLVGFLRRCRRTLQKVELEQQLGRPDIARNFDWGPVFQSLTQCPCLWMLKLGNACVRVSNESSVNLQMPGLLTLGLQGVDTTSRFLLRLIQANQKTLHSVNLLGVDLDDIGMGARLPPASNWKDPDWVSVFEALKACPELERIFIWNLQIWFSVEARKDPGVLNLFKAMSDPKSASTIPLPDAVRFIIHSRTNDLAANMDAYHKLGELIRLVLTRTNNDWSRIQPPWCKKWLASRYPLADIRSGNATSTDVFPQDQWTQEGEAESTTGKAVVVLSAFTAVTEES